MRDGDWLQLEQLQITKQLHPTKTELTASPTSVIGKWPDCDICFTEAGPLETFDET